MDINKLLDAKGDHFESRYVADYNVLADVISSLKKSGKKIVLTQGVWDMLHLGHIGYLKAAAACGDVLVVGVDSDEFTKKRKGPSRPFDSEDTRLKTLAALRFVNIVTLRHTHNEMGALVKVVRPDVLVVSETTQDFTKENLEIDSQYCGEIRKLPPQAETSTTAKLRSLMLDGAHGLRKAVNDAVDSYLRSI
jgi:rfaE bifunctional protein nucleotidyltransferase chain/domain